MGGEPGTSSHTGLVDGGNLPHPTKYQKRISGLLLDRIDIHVEVPRVEYDKLSDRRLGERSAGIQASVEAAREIQRARFSSQPSNLQPVTCNSDMRPAEVRQYCNLDDTGRALMKTAMSQLQFGSYARCDYRHDRRLCHSRRHLSGIQAALILDSCHDP